MASERFNKFVKLYNGYALKSLNVESLMKLLDRAYDILDDRENVINVVYYELGKVILNSEVLPFNLLYKLKNTLKEKLNESLLDMPELQSSNSQERGMRSPKELYDFLADQKKGSWGNRFSKYFKDVADK